MRRGAVLGAVAAGLVATVAHAQPLAPSPDQIRAAYTEASADWRPVPPLVRTAFVLAEDKNFWTRSPSLSTLTRTVTQIATKGGGALGQVVVVEQTLHRDEIADWFVNDVFLGQSCYGVQGAAQAYFGKDVAGLSLAEAALLATLPVDPHAIKTRPDRAKTRRDKIIDDLLEARIVSLADAAVAKAAPLGLREPLGVCPL